ncbi:unnamed protein product [Moneuplotes crassus]|uniref:Uncharacterized protein n=1 Tax=Euplotes crassus TaxID=5936 RepID=A0AAD1U7S7_EUPCR|nr:unnamed protein product [Moneuplotes crassus]
MEVNDWETKSIESELDRIRAKYLMSPSDFDKSSSLKQINILHTGTFKGEGSTGTRKLDQQITNTQSIDKYENGVREFMIGHPVPLNLQTLSSNTPNSTWENQFNTIRNDEKENDYGINLENDIIRRFPQSTKNSTNQSHFTLHNPSKFAQPTPSNLPKPVPTEPPLCTAQNFHPTPLAQALPGQVQFSAERTGKDTSDKTKVVSSANSLVERICDNDGVTLGSCLGEKDQMRNRGNVEDCRSGNSLESRGKCCYGRDKSATSSIERERMMYESLPNSRFNSRNRCSAIRSKIEQTTKMPDLQNVKEQEEILSHSFNENQPVYKENTFKQSIFDDIRRASNISLAPHMESYLNKKLIQASGSPEIEKISSNSDENREKGEYPDLTEETAMTNHHERLKRISSKTRLDSKKKKRSSKRLTACSNSRLSNYSKRSKSKQSQRKRSCSRNHKNASQSAKRNTRKSIKRSIPSGKSRGKKPKLAPKSNNTTRNPKPKKINTTVFLSNPCEKLESSVGLQEIIKEATDSKFLEVIDNLRELRRKNYNNVDSQGLSTSKSNRSIKTEIEFESSVVELISAYNKCLESIHN